MGELHALRRPGGAAGGVDQGQDVLRLHGAPGGLEVEFLRRLGLHVLDRQRAIGAVAVHDDHVVDSIELEDALEKGALGDEECASASPTWYWICSGVYVL